MSSQAAGQARHLQDWIQDQHLDSKWSARQAARHNKAAAIPLDAINPDAIENARLRQQIRRIWAINTAIVLTVAVCAFIGFLALLYHYLNGWWAIACIPIALIVRWFRDKYWLAGSESR